MVSNPWLLLPAAAPFVLASDRDALDRFQKQAKPEHTVDPTLQPEPFLGRPDAPVVLLGLNPGWSAEDARWHADPAFARLCRQNLRHEASEYPFYLLNPAIAQAPGAQWWRKRLRQVHEAVGLEVAARGILCVEYFPYHSRNFGGQAPLLPSQQYSFALVGQAIARNAVVVVMRSSRLWRAAIPGLASYARCFTLNNPQSVYVSPRNCPLGFPAAIEALTGPGAARAHDA